MYDEVIRAQREVFSRYALDVSNQTFSLGLIF